MFNIYLFLLNLCFCLCYNDSIAFNNFEFYNLINKEGEIVLHKDYNIYMDVWDVVTPKFTSLQGNCTINLVINKSNSIQIFSKVENVIISDIIFTISNFKYDVILNGNGLIARLMNSIIKNINIIIKIQTIVLSSQSNSKLSLLSNTVVNSEFNNINLIFNNLIIDISSNNIQIISLICSEVVNSREMNFSNIFVNGNGIEFTTTYSYSCTKYFGGLFGNVTNINIFNAYVVLNEMKLFIVNSSSLYIGGLISNYYINRKTTNTNNIIIIDECYFIIRKAYESLVYNKLSNIVVGGFISIINSKEDINIIINNSNVDIIFEEIYYDNYENNSINYRFGGFIGYVNIVLIKIYNCNMKYLFRNSLDYYNRNVYFSVLFNVKEKCLIYIENSNFYISSVAIYIKYLYDIHSNKNIKCGTVKSYITLNNTKIESKCNINII